MGIGMSTLPELLGSILDCARAQRQRAIFCMYVSCASTYDEGSSFCAASEPDRMFAYHALKLRTKTHLLTSPAERLAAPAASEPDRRFAALGAAAAGMPVSTCRQQAFLFQYFRVFVCFKCRCMLIRHYCRCTHHSCPHTMQPSHVLVTHLSERSQLI